MVINICLCCQFASAATLVFTLIGAIITNELSELALQNAESVHDIFEFDSTPEEYIQKYGNSVLRTVMQLGSFNSDASAGHDLLRSLKPKYDQVSFII